MNVEALRVRDVELVTPPSEGLPAGVGVVTVLFSAGSLGNHPVDRHLRDVSSVRRSVATGIEPPSVAPLRTSAFCSLELPDQLQSGERTGRVPLYFNFRVPIFPDLLAEICWGLNMLASRTMAPSVNFPGASVLLDSGELSSSSKERGALPTSLPVVLVLSRLLHAVYVFAGPETEDKQVVSLNQTLQKPHQTTGMLRSPFLSEGNLEFVCRRNPLRECCRFTLRTLFRTNVRPNLTHSVEVASRFGPS